MNLKDIQKMAFNGEVHKEQMDYLFNRIEEADKALARIARLSEVANNRHLTRSQEMVELNTVANNYLDKYKESDNVTPYRPNTKN